MALDGHLVATLKSWRTQQVAERLALGESYRDREDLVFTWQDGGPVPPDYVTSTFGRLTMRMEVPRITFHSLRHTHATLLLREAVPVHVVAKRLGQGPQRHPERVRRCHPRRRICAVDTFTKAVWGN